MSVTVWNALSELAVEAIDDEPKLEQQKGQEKFFKGIEHEVRQEMLVVSRKLWLKCGAKISKMGVDHVGKAKGCIGFI